MTDVVSLQERIEKVNKELEAEQAGQVVEENSFEETMRKNAENKRRQEEDRKKANKGVIRSYRLKT